jgi:hypothetical protein
MIQRFPFKILLKNSLAIELSFPIRALYLEEHLEHLIVGFLSWGPAALGDSYSSSWVGHVK